MKILLLHNWKAKSTITWFPWLQMMTRYSNIIFGEACSILLGDVSTPVPVWIRTSRKGEIINQECLVEVPCSVAVRETLIVHFCTIYIFFIFSLIYFESQITPRRITLSSAFFVARFLDLNYKICHNSNALILTQREQLEQNLISSVPCCELLPSYGCALSWDHLLTSGSLFSCKEVFTLC